SSRALIRSCPLWPRRQGGGDRRDRAFPPVRFFLQPFTPLRRQLVKFGPPVVFRFPPLRLEQSLTHQPEQGRIQRSLLDEQPLSGNLLDPGKNRVTMKRSERDGLENEQIQCARQQFGFLVH